MLFFTGRDHAGENLGDLLALRDQALPKPQILVLTPTRELAIQVAEAFARYASRLAGFRVLPIYGGQDDHPQNRALKRSAHVIVGTPGRVMDHIRRGRLTVSSLTTLALDEADEMLKMAFIDDVVEAVLPITSFGFWVLWPNVEQNQGHFPPDRHRSRRRTRPIHQPGYMRLCGFST